MNWDAIGAVVELLGAIGVNISLAYLAYLATQIKHSAAQTTEHSRALRISAIDSAACSKNSSSHIRTRTLAISRGASTEASWFDHRQAVAANLRQPGIRTWRAETRAIYADDFEEVVEELIREQSL